MFRSHCSVAALVAVSSTLIACGGSVSPTPDPSPAQSIDAGSTTANQGDGSAATCTPRPGCSSTERCIDACSSGASLVSDCSCVRGEWKCGSSECPPHPTPATCPPTAPPNDGQACSASGLKCDYGPCRDQCTCEQGTWQCIGLDCVAPAAACPSTPVTDGSACSDILAKCSYTLPNDKIACICSIQQRWVCTPIN